MKLMAGRLLRTDFPVVIDPVLEGAAKYYILGSQDSIFFFSGAGTRAHCSFQRQGCMQIVQMKAAFWFWDWRTLQFLGIERTVQENPMISMIEDVERDAHALYSVGKQ